MTAIFVYLAGTLAILTAAAAVSDLACYFFTLGGGSA